MTIEIQEYHSDFFQEIQRRAEATGCLTEDVFFDVFCERLVDSGELATADRALYQGARGVRVDGYGGDPNDADGVLSLIVADFSQALEIETLTATDMDAHFKRAVGFLGKALDRSFRNGLEETSPAFGAADTIASTWESVRKVKVVLITNRLLSRRIDGHAGGEFQERPIVYSMWDIGRLFRYDSTGREREDLVVEMSESGGPVPALPAHLSDAGYEAYLAVLTGEQLASIYERWGARLLEQNVRVFLQARGAVNKGIKNTLDNEPSMFFAYNNGITATAESVETVKGKRGLEIIRLKNLQIVNGGQTTASIALASRRGGVDLSKVFVQMKLSIIPHDLATTVVPKISEFANSQNKVTAADFFANHPFHLRMKQFSRTLYAPAVDGTFKQSKWFYERARGEYQDARANLTGKRRTEFDLEYPRKQIFTKTDLAKFLSVWEGVPHLVSKGAQSNFASFADRIGKAWDANPDAFNQAAFEDAVAKAIVFHETERIVSSQPWYEGAYRANIVAYAIAKLAHDVGAMGKSVDFNAVWRKQGVSGPLEAAIVESAKAAFSVITNPPAGAVKNITEWAKRPGCWTNVQEMRVAWPKAFIGELVSAAEERAVVQAAKKDQRILNGVQAQMAVTLAGTAFWREVRAWGARRKILSIKEADILELAATIDPPLLSDKQSAVLLSALSKIKEDGFSVPMPDGTGT